MKAFISLPLISLALAAFATSSVAAVKSELHITGLNFQLIDMRPDDGMAPWLEWSSESSSPPTTSVAMVSLSPYLPDDLLQRDQADGAFAPVHASLAQHGANADASIIAGELQVAASTQGPGLANASLEVWRQARVLQVSPFTELVVSGVVRSVLDRDTPCGPHDDRCLDASSSFNFFLFDGNTGSDEASVFETYRLKNELHAEQSQDFRMVLFNEGGGSANYRLYLNASAYASTPNALAVPEPAGGLLAMAGALVLLIWLRLRRRDAKVTSTSMGPIVGVMLAGVSPMGWGATTVQLKLSDLQIVATDLTPNDGLDASFAWIVGPSDTAATSMSGGVREGDEGSNFLGSAQKQFAESFASGDLAYSYGAGNVTIASTKDSVALQAYSPQALRMEASYVSSNFFTGTLIKATPHTRITLRGILAVDTTPDTGCDDYMPPYAFCGRGEATVVLSLTKDGIERKVVQTLRDKTTTGQGRHLVLPMEVTIDNNSDLNAEFGYSVNADLFAQSGISSSSGFPSGGLVSSVPEPAAWALMAAGLLAAGGALKGRRQARA